METFFVFGVVCFVEDVFGEEFEFFPEFVECLGDGNGDFCFLVLLVVLLLVVGLGLVEFGIRISEWLSVVK